MFARFFIDRPIFAWVVSLVTLLGGLVAHCSLPTELYPNITPPTVQVTASLSRCQCRRGVQHRGGPQ